MENYIVAIYCFVDDCLKICAHKDESLRKTTDAEIITTALVAARYFGCNMVKSRMYMRSHHGVHFIDKSGFNRRLHGLEQRMVFLFYSLGHLIKELNCESRYIIDSFPVKVCHNIRIANCKILKDRKLYRGKCVSKREYFYGFKVQMIVSEQGIPIDFYLLAGSLADITALQSMNIDLPENSELYGDSAYTDYSLEDNYREHEKIHLKIARKSNSKRMEPAYCEYFKEQMRKRIETTFSEIQQYMPAKIHAVTAKGFILKIFLFILAYTIFRTMDL